MNALDFFFGTCFGMGIMAASVIYAGHRGQMAQIENLRLLHLAALEKVALEKTAKSVLK